MFAPIEIPYDCVMLFNTAKLKPDVDFDDIELALGELCSTVKETYGDEPGGFLAGQVFKFAGFISDEGSVGEYGEEGEHVAIVTYWNSFEQHETSHADDMFKQKFAVLAEMCTEIKELGYELLWQGASPQASVSS